MMSASNDMSAMKKEVAQRWMVWLLMDRSHITLAIADILYGSVVSGFSTASQKAKLSITASF